MEALLFGIFIVVIFTFFRKLFFTTARQNQGSASGRAKGFGNKESLAKFGIGFKRKSQQKLALEKPVLELNPENSRVLEFMENTKLNIFLTGKAGTGKSTLLKYFRATTKKNVAVVAPTGVAAINVQGQTVHRFFKFRPDITLDKSPKISRQRRKSL